MPEAASAAIDHDVVVVGAGFAGVYQLHRLRQLGLSVLLIEAGSELGGIWHWNGYPGARVDSHVPIYEFSDPAIWTDWYWSERFPGRDELRRYFNHVDNVWGISPDVRFDTRVEAMTWEEPGRRWTLRTNAGDHVRCRFVVLCTGFASKPHVPDLPGLETFAGECHHTARWPQDGLDLAGLRVGVIGTGASGVQVIQETAKVAESLTVFQRTPILALPMQQRSLTRAEQDAAKADYPAIFQLRTETNSGFDVVAAGESALEVSAAERTATYDRLWEAGGLSFWTGNYRDLFTDVRSARLSYDFWRERTLARIADPATAELLAPAEPPHPFGAKRPSLEQDFYEAFDHDHVGLVDLHRDPIEAITPTGVRTSTGEIPLDVLVLATGFDAVTGGLTSIDITGVHGRTLAGHWARGVRSHLGLASGGFPNLVYLYGPQSPSGFCNGPTCAEVQGDWVVDLLDHLTSHGIDRIEAQPAAEDEWRELVHGIADATLFPLAESWYMGANVPGKQRELLNFPSLRTYREACDDVATDGYRGFTLG